MQDEWMDGPREFPLPTLDSGTPLPDDLPVAGGWGYTKEDACIILDDEAQKDDGEVHGRSHAGLMIPERLQRELNAMQPPLDLVQVRWKTRTHDLIRKPDGSLAYDCFKVEIGAFLRPDYEVLERKMAQAKQDTGFSREISSLRYGLRLVSVREFWFDISRIKGIPDDAGMMMTMYRGEFR